jgi:N-acetylglucosaminyl-diphospho-decaprenol L-rhamnosyltransferase
MKQPAISIIIVNWNTKVLLRQCLISLRGANGVRTEVIVVDNASTDGSPEMVKKDFPRVRLIRCLTNSGMGSGNNAGMKVAKGRYFILLNSDTIVPRGAFKKLLNWLERHPDCDVVGPQLRYPDGRLQTSGGYFPTLLNIGLLFLGVDDLPILNRYLPLYQRGGLYLSGKQPDWFTREHPVDWLMGACILLKREVFDRVGGFEEKIFMYVEEVEWFYRIKESGYSVWYTPEVWVIHRKGGSSASGIEGPVLGEIRGLKLFFAKHNAAWERPFLNLILKVGALGRIVLFTVLHRPALVAVYRKAIRL